jgi:hypothetical protein
MATQEIYIRNASETEARGPFNPQQVADLAEAGQVNAETLIYEAVSEQWVAINTQPDLMAVVFPEKKKLILKNKEVSTLNQPAESTRSITVDDMLAAAEGRTDDTRGKSDPQIAMARAARLGLWGAIASLVFSAASTILPGTDTLFAMTGEKLLVQPLVLLGVADLVLAVLLGLGMTVLYPLIRFRAALGLGLFGVMYFASGDATLLLAATAGSVGLYLCTVVLSLIPALVAVAAACGGMGFLAWQVISR